MYRSSCSQSSVPVMQGRRTLDQYLSLTPTTTFYYGMPFVTSLQASQGKESHSSQNFDLQ